MVNSQIMNFLVNVSLSKPLNVTTSNFVDMLHDVNGFGQCFVLQVKLVFAKVYHRLKASSIVIL